MKNRVWYIMIMSQLYEIMPTYARLVVIEAAGVLFHTLFGEKDMA